MKRERERRGQRICILKSIYEIYNELEWLLVVHYCIFLAIGYLDIDSKTKNILK